MMARNGMTVNDDRISRRRLHPLHGILLSGMFPLFLGGLVSDIAYSSSHQIEWSNFASWLIAAGLVFGGFALLWTIIDLIRADRRGGRLVVYMLLLLATWVVGFLNSLTHARDAWATMPLGLILSAIVVLLALASTWVGFARFGVGGGR
jgi:uncharacterized membrane protein